jgi:FkbM family methyltransferase
VASFLRQRVLPGAVCVDIGANVGVYVLQFAHWSRPGGHVIAFEPNPHAHRVLERHVRMNGLLETVDVVPAAVGGASGSANLYVSGADGRSRLGSPNPEATGNIEATRVTTITLDEYCHTHRTLPDWIFIDIEGFEMAALAGAREVVQTRGSALGIVVEMHPSVWDSAGTTRGEFEALITELGRHAVSLTGQVDPLGEHGLVLLAS